MSSGAGISTHYTITSTYTAVKDALKSISASVAPILEEEKLVAFELCIAEAMTNIVEHAYGEEPGHEFSVSLKCDTEGICVTLHDQGAENTALMKASAMPGPETLAEGGYGIALIQQIASKVDYERRDGANITTIWYQ